MTLIDRSNEIAQQKLSETIKNFYRVRLMAKREEEELKKEEGNTPAQLSEHALKKAARQTQTMENIMKEYKVEEVAKAAHLNIENELITGPLPKTRTEFEKAVKHL